MLGLTNQHPSVVQHVGRLGRVDPSLLARAAPGVAGARTAVLLRTRTGKKEGPAAPRLLEYLVMCSRSSCGVSGWLQVYPPLARELFHAAFVSCWFELLEQYQVRYRFSQ